MNKPTLLDLFCGAGGAAVGYHRAGFDIIGVDNRPQPRYPYKFVQADAITFAPDYTDGRNAAWSLATPHLSLSMTLNGSVADRFEQGGRYTLQFVEDPATG